MSRGPDRQTTRADVRKVLVEHKDRREPWTAKEVASEVGCIRRTAFNRLRELAQLGEVETKKAGGKGRVWWLNDTTLERPSVPDGDYDEPDEEILTSMVEHSREPWTTAEIADAVTLNQRQVYDRLSRLHEADLLERKQVGARSYVWWVDS